MPSAWRVGRRRLHSCIVVHSFIHSIIQLIHSFIHSSRQLSQWPSFCAVVAARASHPHHVHENATVFYQITLHLKHTNQPEPPYYRPENCLLCFAGDISVMAGESRLDCCSSWLLVSWCFGFSVSWFVHGVFLVL